MPSGGCAPTSGLSRQRVLQALRDAPEGMTLREVSARVGLHANTVRFHLGHLEEDALVRRGLKETRTGRPPMCYIAVPRPQSRAGDRDYLALARALVVMMATRHDQEVAIEAGAQWARSMLSAPVPTHSSGRPGVVQSVNVVAAVMTQVGFDPRVTGTLSHPGVILQHCPFLELAEEHRDVVCGVHLGLLRGVLQQIDAPLTVERLEPFATPDGCLAVLGEQ